MRRKWLRYTTFEKLEKPSSGSRNGLVSAHRDPQAEKGACRKHARTNPHRRKGGALLIITQRRLARRPATRSSAPQTTKKEPQVHRRMKEASMNDPERPSAYH